MSNMLEKTRALRSEAWAGVKSSAAFAAFKALDDAVVAQGGGSAMPVLTGAANAAVSGNGRADTRPASRARSRPLTHADAAQKALRERGEPMLLAPFMEAAIEKGAQFVGDRALSNFRSAVSKDKRFESVRRDGKYYWWFAGKPLPPGWNETAGPDLLAGPAESSVNSNQKGGEGHAAAPS